MRLATLFLPSPEDRSVMAARRSLLERLDRNSRRIDMLDLFIGDELMGDARMLCAALLDDMLDLTGRLAQMGNSLEGTRKRITRLARSLAVENDADSFCKTTYVIMGGELRASVRELYAAYAVSCSQIFRTQTDVLRRRVMMRCLLGAVLLLIAMGAGWFGYKAIVRELAFRQANFLTAADLLAGTNIKSIQVGGLGQTEESRRQRFIWGFGPQTLLVFTLQQPRRLRLEYGISNTLPGQHVQVVVNDVIMAQNAFPEGCDGNESQKAVLVFNAKAGLNTISFRYDDWNGHKTMLNAEDGRPLAVRFTTLRLVADGDGPK